MKFQKERNKLYAVIFIACIIGYIWLYFWLFNHNNKTFDVCFIKRITNIPCPSCGSTRSIISLANGNLTEAFLINPIGYIVAIIMIVAPIWIALDLIVQRKTLFEFFLKIESTLKRPKYAFPLILLLISNWIWNITKEL
jgi:hypothetical protein